MKPRSLVLFVSVVVALLISAPVEASGIPLEDWEVRYLGKVVHSPGAVGKAVDVSPAIPFVAVEPCRIVDTRGGGVFTGAYGPPILAANATRNFDLNDAPHCPGIPALVEAYSLNFTVTENTGPGDIRAWPLNDPPTQITSVLNWGAANTTIANATIIPAGTNGAITVQVAGNNTHVLIDINGYFSDFLNNNRQFLITANVAGDGVIDIDNLSSADFSSAVFGEASALGGGRTYGVWGLSRGATDSAGVLGADSAIFASVAGFNTAGVRGESRTGHGILGVAEVGGSAVAGVLRTTGGSTVAVGYLGVNSAGTNYGVFSLSNYGGTGAKYFVEPHPERPDLVIRYVSLEGPESGTYFRGRGKFQNGVATIVPPEDFRLVTDAEGLSVQITPIGGMASVGVLRIGLDRIVVQGSRNVEFFYMVNGVRKTHKHLRPIGPGSEYMPASAEATMPAYLTEGQKELLISNGTYNADGTVNLETAQAMGWEKVWAEKAQKKTPATSSSQRAEQGKQD